jgi:hypothetical protein
MLARSNQLQGNNTVPEMIALMTEIVQRHQEEPQYFARIAPDAHLRIEETR